jgi:hypothetical protein
METFDMKLVRQSAIIRDHEDVDDSEEDDDECDCEHTRKIHINNRFLMKTCIWVAKITKL